MAHTDEKAFNALLAKALNERHPRWEVNAEQSGVLQNESGKTPDIVITPRGGKAGNPVVIETEYEPAKTVDSDAASRLGSVLERDGHTIEQVIALRIPKRLDDVRPADLSDEIAAAVFSYGLLRRPEAATTAGTTPSHDPEPIRFPTDGWIRGTVGDLAGFCERIALNEHLLDSAVALLENTVNSVASRLRDALEPDRRSVLEGMAEALHQADDPQTTRMGVAIIANALLFQTAIVGTSDRERGYTVQSPRPGDSRLKTLEIWGRILEINYWPIFATARKVLEAIPDDEAKRAIASLTEMASELASYGVTSTGDMSGQMFGKLISDRKFLATFYTRPASAHLLAEIAVARLTTNWADREQVTSLRVADLACGTGTLLTAAYQRIMARVRRAGGDDKKIHPEMMAKALIGADIMPAAVHLTATLLASSYPTATFDDTGIFLMPYGSIGASGGGVEIGSLELLAEDSALPLDIFDAGREVVGSRGNRRTDLVLDHGAADLVIMNPPFTRPTNHSTAAAAGVPVPAFAGFKTEADEQRLMSARLKKLNRKVISPAGNGNAGLGSNFIDVAHAKVKLGGGGGTIAFVLPFTALTGDAWSASRELLAENYRNICVVAIAATGSTDRAFSADTGMAEVLIIATRCGPDEEPDPCRVLYVNLHERPANLVEAVEIARRITGIASESEDRRSGPVDIGCAQVGDFIRAGISDGGCAGSAEPDLAAAAGSLANGRLWLRRLGTISDVSLTTLGELGSRGPYHLDIRGLQADKTTPRGPFDIVSVTDWRAATYPALWAHQAKREICLVVTPDRQGRVRPGCDKKARAIWATASRLHLNHDFQLNSQPLAACFTEQPSIGGRAWPTFKLHDERWEPTMLLWANTTLGLISFWWVASRQQQGRANLTISRLPELATLDPRTLTVEQLSTASDIFEGFAEREFLPANEAYHDKTRRELDKMMLVDLLGLDERQIMPSLALLRDQWCREPSVHGGKSTRPD